MKDIKTKDPATTDDLAAELMKSNEIIYNLTYYDERTKLPNRKNLINRYNKMINNNKETYNAIFIIDIEIGRASCRERV